MKCTEALGTGTALHQPNANPMTINIFGAQQDPDANGCTRQTCGHAPPAIAQPGHSGVNPEKH